MLTLFIDALGWTVSNVPREPDFKVLFKKYSKFSSLAHPALVRYSLGVRAHGDYPFVSTCSSIEVISLLISSQKYNFRFKSACFSRDRRVQTSEFHTNWNEKRPVGLLYSDFVPFWTFFRAKASIFRTFGTVPDFWAQIQESLELPDLIRDFGGFGASLARSSFTTSCGPLHAAQ